MEAGMNQVAGLTTNLAELPLLREEFGFGRTVCACSACQVHCRHLPGALTPSDLARLCPPGHEMLAWAEEHLRAMDGTSFPTLVPARGPSGHCHWLFSGRCAVHEAAPFGCAFFDSHMTDAEEKERLEATLQARREDAAAKGLYFRVWRHLRQKGLVSEAGERPAMLAEVAKIQRNAERHLRGIGSKQPLLEGELG
jgi:hypothetical protein